MDPVAETKKRLEISRKIAVPLESVVNGVLLGGSMGFGQDYSVTDKSDIDMVVITEPSKLDSLMAIGYFEGGASQQVLELFRNGKINFFWVTKIVEGVEVNVFVYDSKSYVDFCLLHGDLIGFNKKRPKETQEAYGFDGKQLAIKRKIMPFNDGFLYSKTALVEGIYWGGVPRQDFFYSGFIVLQEDNFLLDLEKQVWTTSIAQLVKEHGRNPDVNKVNILNTHFTYQKNPGRLPAEIIEKIKKRTKSELELYITRTS